MGDMSPSGYVTFYRVAFDANQTEAHVLFDYICGGLCGFRLFLVFKKVDVRWIFDREFMRKVMY